MLWNLFYVNFCLCVTNIADVMQIADISEDFCELHGIFGEIIAVYVCRYCALEYILSGKPARYTYMGIYYSF